MIGGYKPVAAIHSTSLQRAYDQVIHDVAIQKLPVMFAIDRAGIVGADGQTHLRGAFDLLSALHPGYGDQGDAKRRNECRQMLFTGYHLYRRVPDLSSTLSTR